MNRRGRPSKLASGWPSRLMRLMLIAQFPDVRLESPAPRFPTPYHALATLRWYGSFGEHRFGERSPQLYRDPQGSRKGRHQQGALRCDTRDGQGDLRMATDAGDS